MKRKEKASAPGRTTWRRAAGRLFCLMVTAALLMTGCSGGGGNTSDVSDGSSTANTEGTTGGTTGTGGTTAPGTTGQTTAPPTSADTPENTTAPNTTSPPVTPPSDDNSDDDDDGDTPALSQRKTSDIGFGYYGLAPDRLMLDPSGNTIIQGDYVNTIIGEADAYTLQFCKKNNTRVWYSVHTLYDMVANGYAGWEEQFDQIVETAKASGAYDALLGWYLDEPVDQEAVKTLSKYAKEKYGKRFFVCYTVSTVAPQIYSDGIREPVTADQAQYLTDIAFDMYWGDQARFDAVLASMKERVARDDVYIWFIPGCYGDRSLASDPTAAAAEVDGWVDQLYMLYDMLKEEEKPGGLMCFAYNFNPDPSVESLYGLKQINEGTDGAWNPLLSEQIKVGREICTGNM